MPAPIVWALLALGSLAVSCRREGEPSPRKSAKTTTELPDCAGKTHVVEFGGEPAVLCHGDSTSDGVFHAPQDSLTLRRGTRETAYRNSADWRQLREKFGFPEMAGLALAPWKAGRDWIFSPPGTWSLEAEKLYSNAVDFGRERGVSLPEAQDLAAKIRPGPGRATLNPKEKAYAFMTASLLLSLQSSPRDFSQAHPEFVKTALEKIEAGRLNLRDLARGGQKGDPLTRALYSISDNTLLISEASLDLFLTKDRSTLIHELYHFFQDAERQALSLVEGEVQAYLIEAEYALGESKLLGAGASPEALEAFIDSEIRGPRGGAHFPIPPALRAVFHRARGEKEKHRSWLETCRDDAEVTKTIGGLFEIMTGPAGPGQDGSVTSRFLRENAERLQESGAERIWARKIEELKQEKKREIRRLQAALSKPGAEPNLLMQYFKALRSSLDVVLMERLQALRLGRAKKTASGDSQLMRAAEELASLRVNRRLLMPTDGVD